jgi:hypothetical protein
VTCPHLNPVVDDQRGRHVILRGERVGRAERHPRAAARQRAHEHGRLRGDVQAGGDPNAGERRLRGETLGDLGDHRHLARGPGDPVRALRRQRRVGDLAQ